MDRKVSVRKGTKAKRTKVHTPKKNLPYAGDNFDDYWDQYVKETAIPDDEWERHGDKDEET